MAGRRQQDQQLLSPPQLQAISVAVADAVTQALAQSGSGNQGPAAQPGPSMSCNPRGLKESGSRYIIIINIKSFK